MCTRLKKLEKNLKKAKSSLSKKYINHYEGRIFIPQDIEGISQNNGILIGHGIVFQGKELEYRDSMEMRLDYFHNFYTQCSDDEIKEILTDSFKNTLKLLEVE